MPQRWQGVLSRWKITPFGLLSLGTLIIAILIAVQGPWVADFWLHAATVDRLAADLGDPGNPMVAADTGSPYYTPYTLLLAVIARLTGMSGIDVLTVWGPVDIALLLWGVRSFARRFGSSPWLAVALFVTMLLLWGSTPLGWSGFISLHGLPLIMGYPSTFAFALTLLLWTGVWRLSEGRERSGRSVSASTLALALLAATIALSHQFTAVLAALGALAILVGRRPVLNRQLILCLLAAAAPAAAAVLLWPYYDLGSLWSATGVLDGQHVMLYERWPDLFGYLAVTLPFLGLRFRRDQLDPLVLMFVLGVAVAVYGASSGHWSWARAIPLAAFAGQAATAFEIVGWLGRFRREDAVPGVVVARGFLVLLTGSACAVGLRVQAGNLLHIAPLSAWPGGLVSFARPVPSQPDFSWITAYIRHGDVVATVDITALRTIPAYGANTVAPAWPDPMLPDAAQRRIDQALIVDPATEPFRRRSLLATYRVRWILMTTGDGRLPAGLAHSEVIKGPQRQVLVRLEARPE